jgi:hypothetical protein
MTSMRPREGVVGLSSAAGAARTRAMLSARLEARREEIEATAMERVSAVSDPPDTYGSEYVQSLRAAVGAALAYAFESIERGAGRPAPIPTPLLAQARLAARNAVSLDTVLRRCLTGHLLLCDFLIQEVEEGELMGEVELRRLLQVQASLFDYLMVTLTDEYER